MPFSQLIKAIFTTKKTFSTPNLRFPRLQRRLHTQKRQIPPRNRRFQTKIVVSRRESLHFTIKLPICTKTLHQINIKSNFTDEIFRYFQQFFLNFKYCCSKIRQKDKFLKVFISFYKVPSLSFLPFTQIFLQPQKDSYTIGFTGFKQSALWHRLHSHKFTQENSFFCSFVG